MPQTQIEQRESIVRFEEDENEQDSEIYERSLERMSIVESTLAQQTTSLPTIIQQSTKPREKLFAHQFYDVYADMTDEEWMKVRNAFVAQYFSD